MRSPLRYAVAAASLALLVGCSGDPQPDRPAASASASVAASAATEPSTAPPADQTPATLASSRSADVDALASAAQSAAQQLESAAPEGPVLGADVSWPQCPAGMGIPHKVSMGLPMPTAGAEYVVIGLTNGPGFHANPCLADQVAYAREHGLRTAAYSVISRAEPDALATYGSLRAVGRAQAEFNVASMRAAGLSTPMVWLDVEQVPYYEWGSDTAANAEVVRGAAAAYADAGYRVGVYSTPYIWGTIVGDLALGLPEWRAAGETSRAEALSRCGDDWSIQGGEAVLGQWVEGQRDLDVTCPGVGDLGEWFSLTR